MKSTMIQPPPPPPLVDLSSGSYLPRSDPHKSRGNQVRPTTAGLLRFPSIPNAAQDAPTVNLANGMGTMSSPSFKDELLRKQSRLSSSSVSPIEDRIKAKREELDSSRQNNELPNLPSKLLATAQREKRPFAYSPDVNDPNNRGKLDLTQIKSPIMRKRLLANMDSTEQVDREERAINGFENHSQSEDNNGINTIRYHETVNFIDLPAAQHQTSREIPILRYNEAPKFYNTRDQTNSSVNRIYTPEATDLSSFAQELDAELESLSLLVSNIGSSTSGQQPIRLAPERGEFRPKYSNGSQTSHRMSTFLPGQLVSGPARPSTRVNQFDNSYEPSIHGSRYTDIYGRSLHF